MSWLGEYVRDQARYQVMNLSAVKIQHSYREKLRKFGTFFIDSRAGLIKYSPKSVEDVGRFRNKWVNRIETLRLLEVEGEDIGEQIFTIYEEMLSTEKVSYEANINTRLKKKWNFIKSKLRIF